MAKYHLGKVKLELVGQQSSPTPVRNLQGGPRGIAGLLKCSLLVLHCIVALLADRSGSIIFVFLQIIAASAFWASPTPKFIFVDYFNTIVTSLKK